MIDSERSAADEKLDPRRAEFIELCKKAHIRYHVLERRAIENYFPDYAIKRVKGDAYRALGAYEEFKKPFPKWAKSENWQIAKEMVLEDLEGTDLGSFIQSL